MAGHRYIARLALMGLGLGLSSQARAMSCDEIMEMVRVNVPTALVVQTMEASGQKFDEATIACLQEQQAPAEVLGAAQKMAAVKVVTPAGGTAAEGAAAPAGSSFDDDDMLGAGLPEEEEPSSAGDPAQIQQAIELSRAGRHQACSQELNELLVKNSFPEHETKIQYYLAKCLFDLGMHHSAQHHFMEVVRRGPSNPYFKYALPRLVAIAEHTGNDAELLRIVDKIPPEAFPRRARNRLAYLMGRKMFDQQSLSAAASYLRQVSPKSELYMRAKYLEGIINAEQGRLKSAVMAFRDVIQAEPPIVGDERKAKEIEDLKELALMNVARIYYGLERFAEADSYYAQVDRESGYWPQALFERAWTNFWLQDLNLSLGLLLTVNSPYFNKTEYLPEATILRALNYFNFCEYADVERNLILFEQETRPLVAELKAFVDQYRSKESQELADQAFDAWFTKPNPDSKLQAAMFSRILRNRDLAALIRHMDMMDEELAAIDQQTGVWRTTIGDDLKKAIEADRQRYKRRAGLILLKELAAQQTALEDLLMQSELIRFEVVDAQRQDYEYRMDNPDVGTDTDRKIDFATSKEIIYWPFNGEFWADELGYYHYTEHGNCN